MDQNILIIAALAVVAFLCLGGALLSRIVAGRQLAKRVEEDATGLKGRKKTSKASTGEIFNKLGAAFSKRPSSQLRQKLIRAGITSSSAPAIFMGVKLVILAVAVVVAVPVAFLAPVSGTLKIAIAVFGVGIGFFLPNLYMGMLTSRRTKEIWRHIPDMVDLIEICVSGGAGFDMAWNQVANEIRGVSKELADEMTLVNLEIQLGEERAEAMRHMADRTGVEELSSLVTVIVQAEKFGTMITEPLRVFAAGMREDRSSMAQEKAEKMAGKMMFPMVVFIFPVVIIVSVGPAGIQIYETFAGDNQI